LEGLDSFRISFNEGLYGTQIFAADAHHLGIGTFAPFALRISVSWQWGLTLP